MSSWCKRGFFVVFSVMVILGLAGCGREVMDADFSAPVVYDLAERIDYGYSEKTWTHLDLGEERSYHFLGNGWGEMQGAPDGTESIWTTCRVATASAFLPEPKDLKLTLGIWPYARSYLGQTVTLLVNGKKIATQPINKGHFEDYTFDVPASVLAAGENVFAFRARYASTRHHIALRISHITLEGIKEISKPARPESRGDQWTQPIRTRTCWRIVVPRSGYLKAGLKADSGTPRCDVYLRTASRRIHVAGFTDNSNEPQAFSLAEFGGERAVLEFENFGSSPVTWTASVGGRVEPRDVNILLLTIDTLRANRLGVMGYNKPLTPVLDALTQKGNLFRRAYAVSNHSGPSHGSLLTSRYPQSHGMISNGREMNNQQISLAMILKDHGYDTTAYVNFAILARGSMAARGFDKRRFVPGTPDKLTMKHRHENVYANAAVWLREYWGDKFFLWVHSQFLHMEDLPAPYDTMYWDSPRAEADINTPGRRFFPLLPAEDRRSMRVDYNRGEIDLTQEELDSVTAYYDGGVKLSDEYVAEFLGVLRECGLDPFTAIIVTADHGVSIGERHRISHAGAPVHNLLHVPLIMVLPGSGQTPGQPIDATAELIDVPPTILSYIGITPPRRMQGMDLMPLIKGETSEGKDAAYAMMPDRQGPWYAIHSGNYHFVMNPHGDEFLELNAHEKGSFEDVKDDHPEVHKRLREQLLTWIHHTPDLSASTDQEVSDEITEILKKSGYLDGSQ